MGRAHIMKLMTHKLLNNKKEITQWLDKLHIKNYELVPNREYGYVVNVEGAVNISRASLDCIAVKFNYVTEHFFCYGNKISSLVGAPEHVGGDFVACYNYLTNLIASPKRVEGSYYAYYNKLVSLEGTAQYVGNIFHVSDNELRNLFFEHFPQYIGGTVILKKNLLPEVLSRISDFQSLSARLKTDYERRSLEVLIESQNNLKLHKL